MNQYKSGRRSLLAATAGVLAAPMLNRRTAWAQSDGFNWQRFKGQSIEVSLTRTPRSELQQKYLPEFEALTGIKVGLEQVPEQQHRQKVVIEFNSGKPSFDVVGLSYAIQQRQFAKGGWLLDLEDMLADPQMTPSDWDRKDFSERGLAYARDNGRLNSLPLSADYWLLYWNKALFEAKNLAYPKTIDEMVAAAKAINDTGRGIAGMVARGQRNANVPVWTQILAGWGQGTVDGSPLRLTTDTPDAIAAATVYQTLMRDAAPQGSAGYNWNEAQSLFMQGRAGMWIDGSGFAQPLEDPKKSRVVGKVGYGVFPAGPKAHQAIVFGDGLGVARNSAKKEAAFLYCLWVSSKTMCNRMLQTGSGIPFRNSTLEDEKTIAALTLPREWVDCARGSAPIPTPGLPIIIPVTEFRDTFGTALTNMIGGADPAVELKQATADFAPILQRSEQA